jgi:MFS family permease
MTDILPPKPDIGWRSLVHGGNAGRSLIITGGVALHAVSIYVVATIMPIVVADIGGLAFFAWTATLYIAGSLTGSAAVPMLLQRFGPRSAYQIGFAVFMAGSLLCSVAPSMPVLLVGRALQGFGGGMLPALGYGTVRVIFPPEVHARAIAMLGSVWGVAALLGPTLGGIFAQYGAWRGAFWVDLVIGLVFAVVAARVLPAGRADTATPRGFPGLRLGLLAAAAIAVSAGGVFGRTAPALAGMLAAIVLVALMMRIDRGARIPLLPTGAFDPRRPIGAVSATLGLMILSTSPCTFVPYLLHAGTGVAPIMGGYANATMALAWTLVSLLTASASRRGARATIIAGPLGMCAGLAVDAVGFAHGSVALVVAGQALIGIGVGVGWAHLAAMMMQVAPPAQKDIAGPFITTTQTLAAAFGSAIAGMTANLAGLPAAVTSDQVAATGMTLFATLAVVPLAASFTAWRTLALTART